MGLELELETDENVIFYTVNAGLTGTYIHTYMYVYTYIYNFPKKLWTFCVSQLLSLSVQKSNLTGN